MKYNEKEYKIENCSNEIKRSRYWSCKIYPDSMNLDYADIIKKMGVKCAVSPIHDRDVFNSGDNVGQLKKPHYHLLFKFNSGYRLSDFAQIVDTIQGDTHVTLVRDCNVYHDYLWHKNEIDKFIYDPNDIYYINSNRFDYVTSEFKEILNYMDDNKIMSFRQLTRRLRNDEQDNLLEYVSRNPYYIMQYINDCNQTLYGRLQNLMDTVNKICDNILEDGCIDYEVIKQVKSEVAEYIVNTPSDVPF